MVHMGIAELGGDHFQGDITVFDNLMGLLQTHPADILMNAQAVFIQKKRIQRSCGQTILLRQFGKARQPPDMLDKVFMDIKNQRLVLIK